MNWSELLAFARGPMFTGAFLFFIAGMLYRLISVIMLGWRKSYVPAKSNRTTGALTNMLRGLIIFPFIPRLRDSAARNPVTFIAGGLFHLSFFVVVFLGAAHVLAWKSILGFGWVTLPLPIIDLFAAIGLASLFVLYLNRINSPVLRLLSRTPDYLNLLVVFLPFLTGYFMTHRLLLRYEEMYAIHVITVNVLLIWIPLSRISHFMFYFITKPRLGALLAQRGAKP
jgi:nitrate reductase gamma subunit